MKHTPLAAHRPVFRAFAVAVVPEAAALDERGWSELERTVEYALGMRPPRLQRQLGVLLRLLEHGPVLRYGRRFSRLDADRRTRVAEAWQHAPLKLLRRGVWGLRTLVLMGYYTRDAAIAAVGYRAHARGWRRDEVAP